MNKRIQKKVAKRLEQEAAEQAAVEDAEMTGEERIVATLKGVRAAASEVEQAVRKGDAKGAARIVQERTGEAIGQLKVAVSDVIDERQEQLREKLEETEKQAEELLKKVPVVGKAAAKALHDVTHR